MDEMHEDTAVGGAARTALAAFCLLGAYALVTRNLGHVSPELCGVLALLLLGLYAALLLSRPPAGAVGGWRGAKRLVPAALALAAGAAAWSTGGEVERCLAVLCFTLSVRLAGAAFGRARGASEAHLVAGVLITAYVVALKFSPWVWLGVQEWSLLLSSNVTRLVGAPHRLGATAAGTHLFVFFVLYALSLRLTKEAEGWKPLGAAAGGAAAAQVVYLLGHEAAFVPLLDSFQNPYHTGHSHYQVYPVTALNTTAFLLLMLAAPLWLVERGRRPPEAGQRRQPWGRRRIVVAAACGVAVCAAAWVLTAQALGGRAGEGGKVVLYDKGYLDWNVPVFGQYGERSAGMFGLLPFLLEADGYEVKRESALTDEALAGARTLVVINLQQALPPAEHEAVWKFVRGGGSLLLLGDHTGVAGIREPSDHLLEPVGIKFRFDSAHYVKDWEHAFEVFPHPTTRGVGTSKDLSISVGASLEIPASASPVVVGKYGFSDLGNANNPEMAFLGDRAYNRGELLGDLVLVAWAGYGRGKVLVFGDTSTLQNGALTASHEFTRNIFGWLAGGSSSPGALALTALLCLLLLAAAGLTLLGRAGRLPWAYPGVVGALFVGLCAPPLFAPAPPAAGPLNVKAAYIDTSHMERIESKYTGDRTFFGLAYNLARNGYLALEMERFDASRLGPGDVFVSVAPVRPFTGPEIGALEEFVEKGGTFILCTGWEEAVGSSALLRRAGLGVANVPLGPVEPGHNTKGIQFYNAWPISLKDPSASRVVVETKERQLPLVVERRHGAGRLYVIGDPNFLGGANLESFTSHRIENIEFLSELLQPNAPGGTTAQTEEGGRR